MKPKSLATRLQGLEIRGVLGSLVNDAVFLTKGKNFVIIK